jgi:TonB family protein
MLLPRQPAASTLLKLLFIGASLSGAGTRPFLARAQEQQQEKAAAQQTAAATAVNVITPPDTARAIKLYNENDYGAAIDVLRGAVKRRKDDAQAWLHLGIAYSRAGKSKDARKAFERAIKISPNTPQAYIGMAYIFMDAEALADAERHALRAIAVDAGNAEAHYALGLIALRQNSPAKALAEAETALRLNPNFAGALILKSEAALEVYAVGHVERDAKYRALNQPVPPLSAEERAGRKKMLTEAAESLEKYLKMSPSSPSAARLREQAETLRLHVDAASGSGGMPSVYPAGEVTTRANIVSKPEPLYTERARNSGITGTVRLRMLLSFDGRVRQIHVVKGLGGGLTEKAIEAARAIKFTPAVKDGRPVSQFVTIEYNFNIY